MADEAGKTDETGASPAPEALTVQTDQTDASAGGSGSGAAGAPGADGKGGPKDAKGSKDAAKQAQHLRRGTYRPGHKGTFIGLAVVLVILGLNAAAVFFLFGRQTDTGNKVSSDAVTISADALSKLGVNRNTSGTAGALLVVGPDAKFAGKVTVGSDVSVAGELKLNSKFSASDASLAKLEAGTTSLGQLSVNGDGTVTSLTTRKDLQVAGSTRLQGSVTIAQLTTINNSLNVAGNLAIGGTLSARAFEAGSLISDTTLTIGGHVITRGVAPGAGPGSAVGSNGTVSISGNDASGTVAVNIGVGGGNGVLAQVAFHSQFAGTPHVVVTPVGRAVPGFYVNRSAGGFSIGVEGAMSPGGYAFDYVVMQ